MVALSISLVGSVEVVGEMPNQIQMNYEPLGTGHQVPDMPMKTNYHEEQENMN